MACEQWRGKIERYADGELPAEQLRALDAHMRACPACAADALAQVQLKRAVQQAGKRYTPTAELRQRITKQISARKRSAGLRGWLPSLAAAAVASLVLVVGVIHWEGMQRERTFAEVADLHVATLASTNPVDVVSTDRHTVKPWFAGKLPFTFNLPELANTPFTLVGGRMAYVEQSPGAELLFQVRQHRISVFIFQDRGEFGRLGAAISMAKQLSFNLETWSEGGLRYFVITDASSEDVRQLSERLRRAGQS